MLPVALQPTEATAGLEFTTVSELVPNPPKPVHVGPLARERRRCLLELTEQSFPDGKVADAGNKSMSSSGSSQPTAVLSLT